MAKRETKRRVGFAAICQFLRTNPTARSVLIANASERLNACGIADVTTPEDQYALLGVSKSTFYEAGSDVKLSIAQHYDTGLSGDAWTYLDQEDAEEFQLAYLDRHKDHDAQLPALQVRATARPAPAALVEPAPTRAPPFPSLKHRRTGPPQAINARLASVWIAFEQGDVSLPMIELNCQPAEVDPLLPRIVIQRAILEARFDGPDAEKPDQGGPLLTSLGEAHDRLDAFMASHKAKGGKPAFSRLAGPRNAPSWEFEMQEGSLDLRAIVPLCELASLAAGQKIYFLLRVESKEFICTDSQVSDAVAVEGVDTPAHPAPIARADGSPLGRDRLLLMKLLWEKSLPGRRHGSMVVASDEIILSSGGASAGVPK